MPHYTSQPLPQSSSSKNKSEVPANSGKKCQISQSNSSSSTSTSTSEHSLEHSSEHSADYSTEVTSSSSEKEHSLMYQNQNAIFRRNTYSIHSEGAMKGVGKGRERGRVDGGDESLLMQNESNRGNVESSTKYRLDMARSNTMRSFDAEKRMEGVREEEVENEVEESSVDSSVEMQAYVPPSRKDRYLRTYNSTNTISPSITQNLAVQDPHPSGGKRQNPGPFSNSNLGSTFTSPSSSLKSSRKSPGSTHVQTAQGVHTGTGSETGLGGGSVGVSRSRSVSGYSSSLQELADLSIRWGDSHDTHCSILSPHGSFCSHSFLFSFSVILILLFILTHSYSPFHSLLILFSCSLHNFVPFF